MVLPLTIEELGGAGRSVTLTGWALPRRNDVGWGAEQRYNRQWYAGSSVATIQILGREEMDPSWEGIWNDRFVAPFVSVDGFAEVAVAQDLVRIFEALRDSGGELRVQWGSYVRRGILAMFEPAPLREVDIPWRMEWAWSSRDDATSARASIDTPPEDSRFRQLLNEVDDVLAFEPRDVTREYSFTVRSAMRGVRDRATRLFELTRQGADSALSPITLTQALVTEARGLAEEARDVVVSLADLPFIDSTISDDVPARVGVGSWRRNMTQRLNRLQGQALRTARQAEQQSRPDATAIVVIRTGQTLRDIARDQYGSADEWLRIAEVNNLQTSTPPVGTAVLVPPLSTPVDPVAIPGAC